MIKQLTDTQSVEKRGKRLYQIAGVAALVALAANVLDVILGFGETEMIVYGAQRATDWFALYQDKLVQGLIWARSLQPRLHGGHGAGLFRPLYGASTYARGGRCPGDDRRFPRDGDL